MKALKDDLYYEIKFELSEIGTKIVIYPDTDGNEDLVRIGIINKNILLKEKYKEEMGIEDGEIGISLNKTQLYFLIKHLKNIYKTI